MTEAEITSILGIVATVAGLAEKYGPEVYETVKTAIDESLSKTGPTKSSIQEIYEKCLADNQAIQSES